jgi:hypothetical protein
LGNLYAGSGDYYGELVGRLIDLSFS